MTVSTAWTMARSPMNASSARNPVVTPKTLIDRLRSLNVPTGGTPSTFTSSANGPS